MLCWKRRKYSSIEVDAQIKAAFPTNSIGILRLYGDKLTTIPIIDNLDLNKFLESLASLLSTYIAKANQAVTSLP
ncbi:hypothetical protein DFQ26_001523, partial [Actinomortierella ambigua]